MSQPLTVVECALQGATVGVVEATDDDLKNGNQGNKPTYSLEATDAYNDYKKFRIDKNSGTITVAANPLPDYATQQTYRVRVVATDGSDPTFTSEVDVTIMVLPYLDNLFDGDNAWTNYVAPENMAVVDGSSGKVVTDGDMGAFLPSRYTFGSSEVELTQLQGAPKGKPVILGRPTDVSGNPIKSSSYLTIVPDASDDPTEVTGETIDADYDAAVEAMDKQHFAITDGTKTLQAVIEGTGNSTSDATVMVLKGSRFKSVYISDNDLDKYAKDGLLLFILMLWLYKKDKATPTPPQRGSKLSTLNSKLSTPNSPLSTKVGTGWYFGLCLTWIFTFRFFVEFLKKEQVAFEQGMPLDMGQLLSIPFIIVGGYYMWRAMKCKNV